jgi:hypothetical protein
MSETDNDKPIEQQQPKKPATLSAFLQQEMLPALQQAMKNDVPFQDVWNERRKKLYAEGKPIEESYQDPNDDSLAASKKEFIEKRTVLLDDFSKHDAKPVPPLATTSQKDWFADTITQYSGVALAETHTQNETVDFARSKLAEFKKLGGDTIYIERIQEDIRKLSLLSDTQLDTLLKEGEVKFIDPKTGMKDSYSTYSASALAHIYGTEKSDDVQASYVSLIKEARQQGIRIVGMDLPEGDFNELRIALANHTWSNRIENDRKTLHPDGHDTGKYMLIGGMAHLIGSGMVDDALGIPVVAWDRGNKENAPKFNATQQPQVILAGGEDYSDASKNIRSMKLDQLADTLDGMHLPNKEKLQTTLLGNEDPFAVQNIQTRIRDFLRDHLPDPASLPSMLHEKAQALQKEAALLPPPSTPNVTDKNRSREH